MNSRPFPKAFAGPQNKKLNQKPSAVGQFIKSKRAAAGLSQRDLGLALNPQVSTQFISNIERGITPLPSSHMNQIIKILGLIEEDLLHLLEQDYAQKISKKIGRPEILPSPSASQFFSQQGMPSLVISQSHYEFFNRLYEAFKVADPKTQQVLINVCESVLQVKK